MARPEIKSPGHFSIQCVSACAFYQMRVFSSPITPLLASLCVQVAADLIPETKSRAGVQFTLFKIFGLLPIKAPESAKGDLDTTFVDEELRISRGDKGETA